MRSGHENYPDKNSKTAGEAGPPALHERTRRNRYVTQSQHHRFMKKPGFPGNGHLCAKKLHIPLLKALFFRQIYFKEHMGRSRKSLSHFCPDQAASFKKAVFYI